MQSESCLQASRPLAVCAPSTFSLPPRSFSSKVNNNEKWDKNEPYIKKT
jgi:hypothetical protein